jgi:putative tryptophan/tyrosine transport system substrate-binding protein
MQRRKFITLVGGATLLPLAARAQQPTMPLIGFLSGRSPGEGEQLLGSLRQGLKQAGFVEGQNVAIQYRFAEGQYDRLPALAADLVRLQVAVIVAGGTGMVAKKTSTAIPIVFTIGFDPLATGLVSSINRPDGNMTGVTFYSGELNAKQLELLRQIAPKCSDIGYLVNPKAASAQIQTDDAFAAAAAVGLKFRVLNAGTEPQLEASFATLGGIPNAAMLVGVDPFFDSRPERVTALAARYKVAAVYSLKDFVKAGGLASYGASITDAYRQAGVYVGQILKGSKVGDLPVQFPTKFELAINLKAARGLGLEVPPTLLATADEVIE